MSMNDPMPKGGYQAILEIVDILGENGSQTIEEIVLQLSQFGYQIEENNGDRSSPALSPGNRTYDELTHVLGFAEPEGNNGHPLETKLKLTESSENEFNIDSSGERVYELLTAEMSERTKRGAVGSLILLKLSESDINTGTKNIPHTLRTFLSKMWEQKDEDTGRYQTKWRKDNTYFKDILTDPEISEDWNQEKLKHCAQRAMDLGICRRVNRKSQPDIIYPVLVEDIFQATVFFMNEYYKQELTDSTPNINQFYEDLTKWYPISREYFEQNILYEGLLNKNTEIEETNYPVIYELLNQNSNHQKYDTRWLEGEDSWNDNVKFAEFEIVGMN